MSTAIDFDHFRQSQLGPLAFVIDNGRAYTFSVAGDMVDIIPGTVGAETIVVLGAADWESFVTGRFTRYGVRYNANPRFDSGDFTDLCRWEPALRALFHGRPVCTTRSVRSEIAKASRLISHARSRSTTTRPTSRTSCRPPGTCTCAVCSNPAEVHELGAEVDQLVTLARPDDPRIRAFVTASGEVALEPNLGRNEGTKIIIKHPGATEGLTTWRCTPTAAWAFIRSRARWSSSACNSNGAASVAVRCI